MMFKKVWKSPTSYRILQLRDDGNSRYVDEDYAQYIRWCSEGNIPEEIPYTQPTIEPGFAIDPWDTIRKQRNDRLSESDWTQLPDVPLTSEQIIAWREYRRILRDITIQDNPANIVWPVEPT